MLGQLVVSSGSHYSFLLPSLSFDALLSFVTKRNQPSPRNLALIDNQRKIKRLTCAQFQSRFVEAVDEAVIFSDEN